jgi:8-oxo-dGTP pyrophosphatase MutT (NUDIX family)
MNITLDVVRERLARREPRRLRDVARSIEAAVALVLAPGSAQRMELLLIKRAVNRDDPWSGQIALPGGRRESHDPDLLVTATRETGEEVGISLPRNRLLGELDDLHPRTATLPPVVVRPFVFGLAEQPPVMVSAEVASYFWVPLTQLADGETRTQFRIPGRDDLFPAYRVGSDVLWGMTERIVSSFIELLD